MTWGAADDDEETVFRCVNILTGEVVDLEEVDRGDKPLAKPVRQSEPRGEAAIVSAHDPSIGG
jgi:hypothetical protein